MQPSRLHSGCSFLNRELSGSRLDGGFPVNSRLHAGCSFRHFGIGRLSASLGPNYANGVMTDLGTLGGAESSAHGINDAGTIVGSSNRFDGKVHSFRMANGIMTDLGVLENSPYGNGANEINNLGQIVGHATNADNDERAYLYENGMMKDLNSLLLPGSGWELQNATAINDLGQIVGSGLNPQGATHAYLLTPAPEPTAFVLTGIAAAAWAFIHRRRRNSNCS